MASGLLSSPQPSFIEGEVESFPMKRLSYVAAQEHVYSEVAEEEDDHSVEKPDLGVTRGTMSGRKTADL